LKERNSSSAAGSAPWRPWQHPLQFAMTRSPLHLRAIRNRAHVSISARESEMNRGVMLRACICCSVAVAGIPVVSGNGPDDLCEGPLRHPPGLAALFKSIRTPLYDLSGQAIDTVNISQQLVALVQEGADNVNSAELWSAAVFGLIISSVWGILVSLCVFGCVLAESCSGRFQRLHANLSRSATHSAAPCPSR